MFNQYGSNPNTVAEAPLSFNGQMNLAGELSPPAGEAVLRCRNLSYWYTRERTALRDVNLELGGGQIVGLLGPNGSGKTTLMKILSGMLQSDQGTVEIGGFAPGPEAKLKTAYLPDKSFLSKWMKVEDLLYFYESFFPDFDRNKAIEFLKRMKLEPKRSVRHMSVGEKERVAVALTMSRRVKLYLLDEPIAAVDPAMREVIFRTIITDFPEDALVLMATHLLMEAEPYFDQVVFMRDGFIMRAADSETLRQNEGMSVDQYFRRVYAWY